MVTVALGTEEIPVALDSRLKFRYKLSTLVSCARVLSADWIKTCFFTTLLDSDIITESY